MKVKLNNKNEIVAFAKTGDIDSSIEVDDSLFTDDFIDDFKSSYYLYQDDQIVVNPNYEEPSIEIPTPEPSGPSPEMLAINALGVQVAKLMSEKGGV